MNTIAIIILVTLVVGMVLEIIADYLNLSHLKPEPPQEFADLYEPEKYKLSQLYTRETTKFGWVSSIFDTTLFLFFWFLGGFNWLDMLLRSHFSNEIILGLAFMGVLGVSKSILSVPFDIYGTFVLEERYGFNKTTMKTWIMDKIKGTVLGIVIGLPLLSLVLWYFGEAGEFGWLWAWISVTLIGFVIQYVAPTWIMPLFNKFEPLEEGELKTEIMKMAEKADFPLHNVMIMDGSKRSAKSNAFFTGWGKNKRIALFDTLVEQHSVQELVAILAHEIGHYKKKHIVKGTVISTLHTGVLFWLLSVFMGYEPLFEAFFMENTSVYAGLIFFGMLYSPVEMILSIFMQIQSRKHEFEADDFAKTLTGTADYLISALKKLSSHNLSNLTPHPFYVFLNYSHPPLKERISAMRR